MRCPHCGIGVKLDVQEQIAYPSADYSETGLGIEVLHSFCPECGQLVLILKHGKYQWIDNAGEIIEVHKEEIIYPRVFQRILATEIPLCYRQTFNEATSVLLISPKASAALSRRLLQEILRTEYKIVKRDLDKEITEFISLPRIPPEISETVDAIRNIGNFAAHPLKYQNTGEIVDVETGEAEWLLDVLELLFDFTFVQPQQSQARKDELNKKLAALGKPPMKS
ncbi:MAG: DUF4145 domain-containing protein [Anaerolineae bacterium]|nr:DUF4145 domain-containing protein [Anaerolineae bacterium]